MAIDWTPVTSGVVNLTGVPEYRVENDGLVRWRGLVTRTHGGGGTSSLMAPVEARLKLDIDNIYWDWTGGPSDKNINIYPTGDMLIGYYNPLGSVIDLSDLWYPGIAPPAPTHTLPNVFAGIAAALGTIPGLRVYSYPSDKVETPAGILALPQTPYDITLGGRADMWTFPIWVLVSKASDRAAYTEMIPYLDSEGTKSVRQVIENDRTLGGACDSADVINAQPQIVSVGGVEFLAVEFTMEVYS